MLLAWFEVLAALQTGLQHTLNLSAVFCICWAKVVRSECFLLQWWRAENTVLKTHCKALLL